MLRRIREWDPVMMGLGLLLVITGTVALVLLLASVDLPRESTLLILAICAFVVAAARK
jgi:hypothetical protein